MEAKQTKEAEKKAKQAAEVTAKEQAIREAAEAKQAKEDEEKAKKEVVGKTDKGIYQGNFRLVLKMPVSSAQSRQFIELLKQVQDLKIEWTGGSVGEGVTIGVSALKPIDLSSILTEMPIIAGFDTKGADIMVVLKPTL